MACANAPPESTHITNSHNDTLVRIKQLHDEAHLYVGQGLSCDEQGQTEQAVTLYTKGLRCIDKALDLNNSLPQHAQKLQKQTDKMRITKQQIQGRVESLLNTDEQAGRSMDDPPPSYEDATTPTSDIDMLIADRIENPQRAALRESNATELFKIPSGVQMYFITPEGYVSAPSYPSSLEILRLDSPLSIGADNAEATAFLQVGDWTYPLMPGCSPALQTDWASYIFPDTTEGHEGSSVGVIIPDEVGIAERRQLESLLVDLTALRRQTETQAPPRPAQPPPRPDQPPGAATSEQEPTSTVIARGIVDTAEWIAEGIGKGAEKTGQLVRQGTTKLRENMAPADKPTHIGPKTQQGVYYAKKATGAAVTVSAFVVTQLGKATMSLGRQAAPHIRAQGEKYLPQVFKSEGTGRSKMDNVVEVAAGGITGFSTVYLGLENAAKILAKNVADGTVDVVQHKYGTDAGKLTHNALYATGNVALTTNNVRNLGVKAIAKRVAKDTGKAVVEDLQKDDEDDIAMATEEGDEGQQAKKPKKM